MAAISKVIRRSHKLRGATPSISTLCLDFVGRRFQKRIAEYIMPLYPPFWRQFKQNGGHFQSNTSITQTKRRRAFNLDSMCMFCGAYTCRKIIVSYVSVLGINHFNVYGGHIAKNCSNFHEKCSLFRKLRGM